MYIWFIIPVMIGLLSGWVINYLADVLPETLRLGRPACPNIACKSPFAWRDYLLFHRCRKCGKPRRWRTYVIQLLAVLLAVWLWLNPPAKLGFWLGYALMVYLALSGLIDVESRYVLRPLSIAGLGIGLISGIVMHDWISTLIGGAAGFAIMFILYLFSKLFNRWRARRLQNPDDESPLGTGDVTLGTILGLLLGWPLVWFGLLLGILFSGAAAILIMIWLFASRQYKQRALQTFIPYGIFFILGAMVIIYLPGWIIAML